MPRWVLQRARPGPHSSRPSNHLGSWLPLGSQPPQLGSQLSRATCPVLLHWACSQFASRPPPARVPNGSPFRRCPTSVPVLVTESCLMQTVSTLNCIEEGKEGLGVSDHDLCMCPTSLCGWHYVEDVGCRLPHLCLNEALHSPKEFPYWRLHLFEVWRLVEQHMGVQIEEVPNLVFLEYLLPLSPNGIWGVSQVHFLLELVVLFLLVAGIINRQ